jgi:hypothetical protein
MRLMRRIIDAMVRAELDRVKVKEDRFRKIIQEELDARLPVVPIGLMKAND